MTQTRFQIPLLQIAPEGTSKSMGATFLEKKKRLRQRSQTLGASKNLGPFFWGKNSLEHASQTLGASKNMGGIFLEKKKRLRQRTHKFRASKNLGAIFLEKKKRRLRQRTHKFRASKNMGAIWLIWTRISDLDQPPWGGLKGLVQIGLSGPERP